MKLAYALALMMILVAVVLVTGQTMPGPIPNNIGLPFPITTDQVDPIIESVKWKTNDLATAMPAMGTVNVWTFDVKASDNLGVGSALLYVDGQPVGWQGSGGKYLPATFKIQYTDTGIASGQHAFKLYVYDRVGRHDTFDWSMTK